MAKLANDDGNNEWGDFVKSPFCSYFLEIVMPIGELDVVEFGLCGGLCGKEIVGLEAFYEKMCIL